METGAHLRLILWKANMAVEELDQAAIVATGLNPTDFAILGLILNKGPLPVNTIGRKVGLTSGSITTAVDRLTNRNLLVRKQDRHDGRIYNVHLTAKGRGLIKAASTEYADQVETLFETLSASERIVIAHLLKKVGKRADALLPARKN